MPGKRAGQASDPVPASPDACPERCPICRTRCYGKKGHASIKTAGKGYAQPHACRGHIWATSAEWIEITRSEARETRREVKETIRNCSRCLAAVERLG